MAVGKESFGGVAGGGDDFVAFLEALFDVVVAEAGGGTGDEENLGNHFVEIGVFGCW